MSKYLFFYNKHIKTGRLPKPGLCGCFGFDDPLLPLFSDPFVMGYWGYWSDVGGTPILSQYVTDDKLRDDLFYKFTPLRQNIVLLMAAMNSEL